VNLVYAALIVVGAAAAAVGLMLLVRRNAPEGSYFADGDRAAGVFGVLATGFSVLLGFIIFLAFTSYDQSRSGAETEALMLVQQIETAQLLPPETASTLTGGLICYGRHVVEVEWEQMKEGTLGDSISPWGPRLFQTVAAYEPRTASEQSAYDKWLEQTSTREEARLDRTHGAVGVMPAPLWVVLLFISVLIVAFMLFFADTAERAKTQALLMGSVTAVITIMLLLLAFFDNPFQSGVGGLRPLAMERSLAIVDEALGAIGQDVAPPCGEDGVPRD
jgi:amino acid transporter